MLASDITASLRRRHQSPRWCVIQELRLGSGYGFHEARIDLWAIECASRGNNAVAFEIKVSRSDFLRDVKKPVKQRGALLYSNEFYFAAPKGLIRIDELPPYAGLIEFSDTADRSLFYGGLIAAKAPYREKFRPSWPFVISLIRRTENFASDFAGRTETVEDVRSGLAESDEPRTALGDAGAGGEGLAHGQHHEEANEPSTSEVVP